MARELAELGGEAAIREVFEQVMKESGEAESGIVVRLSKAYGLDAIRARRLRA